MQTDGRQEKRLVKLTPLASVLCKPSSLSAAKGNDGHIIGVEESRIFHSWISSSVASA